MGVDSDTPFSFVDCDFGPTPKARPAPHRCLVALAAHKGYGPQWLQAKVNEWLQYQVSLDRMNSLEVGYCLEILSHTPSNTGIMNRG